MRAAILRRRRPLTVGLHVVLTVVANVAAFLLRFDGSIPREHIGALLFGLPLLVAMRGTAFWRFHLYRGLWRYASLSDLANIIFAVASSSVAFGLLAWFGPRLLRPYPRSVLIIDAVLLVGLLGGVRLARRGYREFHRLETERRVLIYGAGDAGEMIVRDMRNNRFYNCDPIGFVDDDAAKVGLTIHGVQVLGTRADLPRILEMERPHEVLVAMPSAESSTIRAIVRTLEGFDVPITTLPNLRDLIDGRVQVSQIRALSLEDLMVRKPVTLDREPLRRFVNGQCVLVTGAGGSIGRELVRQLVQLGPTRIALVERNETALFELGAEIDARHPRIRYEPLLVDVGDEAALRRTFERIRPRVVFHAAAYKHVPLVQSNPVEAVKNNVRGTRLVADLAVASGATDVVLISSDKAVSPSSVMGATKRVGELLIRSRSERSVTRMVAVRFGNVLGSNGSVSRVFTEQIRQGGPVTVTHPDMDRFFMLISEAVQLVLHAAAMRHDGTIFALEMGDPIRIEDFARNLIHLSGYVPDKDIPIEFVGLRPGEKLSERLFEDDERAEPSAVEGILKVTPTPLPPDLDRLVECLEAAAEEGHASEVIRLLSALVPTFEPATSVPVARVVRMPRRDHGTGHAV